MTSPEKHTILDIEIVKETEKAILIKCTETQELLWLPLSQVHEIHPTHIVVSAWIAKQKYLI